MAQGRSGGRSWAWIPWSVRKRLTRRRVTAACVATVLVVIFGPSIWNSAPVCRLRKGQLTYTVVDDSAPGSPRARPGSLHLERYCRT